MKKIILFLICFLFPINVLAYSDYIIPGGETLGIDISSDGIIVVGFYKVNGRFINRELTVGDKILKVNGFEIDSVSHMADLIDKYKENDEVEITYKTGDKMKTMNLSLSYFNGTYRTGLYVKGDVSGIGTLTYVDDGVFGLLGHVINESKTNSKIEIRDGDAFLANVTSFNRSVDGNPGSKNAEFLKDKKFGILLKNTKYGVFGKTDLDLNKKALKVANLDDVHLGDAYIYTTNLNNEIEEYKINILNIFDDEQKNIYFEIIDEELLDMAGGIVQGMSGSPIIQDDKIIGAVTRVLVDDVDKGYGISIITMLEEGDSLR